MVEVLDNLLNVAIRHAIPALSEDQALNLGATFLNAVSVIIREPYTLVTNLNLMTDRDITTIWKWNATQLLQASECMQDYLKRRVQLQPNSPAICAWDAELTYSELDHLSTRLAHYLVGKGVGPEVVVPLSFEKSAWAIVSFLGVIKAGGAVVFIDSSHPVARRQEITSQVNAKLVVTSQKQLSNWEDSGLDVTIVDRAFIESLAVRTDYPVTGVHSKNVLYVIFTSGSTGVPKGCVVEHESFCTGAMAQAVAANITPSSRILQLASYSFDVSVLEILTALMHGACICTPNEASMVEGVAALINKFGINWAFLTPSLVKVVAPREVPNLKTLILGGEALSKSDIETWADHVQLGNGYGPSECSVAAAGNPNLSCKSNPANIGRALGGLTWIVDAEDHNKLVPIGAVGELLIDGPIVARGYLNNPSKTAEVFVESPTWGPSMASGSPRRLYKTGDLARYNSDGTIHFIGRKDTQVKLRGLRIELGEIEHHIAVHELTQHAMVLLPKSGRFAQRLVSVLTLKGRLTDYEDSTIRLIPMASKPMVDNDVAELRQNLAGLVPHYMVPEAWVVLQNMPLMLSGKMARAAVLKWLTEMDDETYSHIAGVEEAEADEELTENEKQLRLIYSEILNLDVQRISLDRSFLSLGGDSISAMQVMSRCRTKGMKLTAGDIIAKKSIKSLALCVQDICNSAYNKEEIFDMPFDLSPVQRMYFQVSPPETNEQSSAHYNQSFFLRLTHRQDSQTLARALRDVVTQHSMLRARMIRTQSGIWQQMMLIAIDGTYDYQIHEVATSEQITPIIAAAQASLSLFDGPVFAAHVFNVREDGSQLLFLVAHHAVIDLVSWRVVLRDLEEAILHGKITSDKPLPYQAWLPLQAEHAREFGDPRSVLPFEVSLPDVNYWGMSGQPNKIRDTYEEFARLDPALTANIMGTLCHAALRTEPIDLIMSVLMYSFSRIFLDRTPPTIFREGHGREPWSDEIDISETVGWFTTMFPLCVDATSSDTIVEFTRQVKDKRRAIPSNGRPYFASRFLNEEGIKAFGQHTQVEICFDYLGLYQQLEKREALLRQEPRTINADTSDIGPGVERFALMEITAEMVAGQMQFCFVINRNMEHQDQIHQWITELPKFFSTAHDSLAKMNPQYTKCDFPMLKLDYSSLENLMEEKLPKLGILNLADIEDIYPCSAMQQGMLISQNKDCGYYKYRQPFEIISKDGKPVEVSRLEAAWRRVVQRHPILRTIFIESIGELGVYDQVVLKSDTSRVSLYTGSKEDGEKFFADQDPIRFNDIQPPHRLSICLVEDDRVYCQLEFNHAIIDGGSMPIVLRDLVLAYEGHLSDRPGPLFSDYLAHVNGLPKSAALNHWQELLGGLEPTYFPALEPSSNIAELKEIDVGLNVTSSALQSFCAEHEITLANLFQVAWAMVLGAYTKSDDVCFGYLSAGREAPVSGIEDAVGPFITMLVCRLSLTGTVLELLQTAQGNFLRSLPHQHACSLAEIQHALELAGQPLFNTVMSIQKEVDAKALQDASISIFGFQNHDPSEYNVTVDFMVSDTNVSTKLGYWSSSISDAHAQNLAMTLSEAIEAILRNADSPIGSVNLVSQNHMDQLLEWNSICPTEVSVCVHEAFEGFVARQPDAPAVCSFDGDLTYAELDLLATNLAHYLVQLGVGPEVLVPFCFPKSTWTIVTLVAIMKAGGASVPLDAAQPISRLKTIIDTTKATFILAAPQNAHIFNHVVDNVVLIDGKFIRSLPAISGRPCTTVQPHHPVYIIFTSGTTGMPKGIVLQHKNIATYTTRMMEIVGVGPGKRVLQFAAYTFDVSISDIHGSLMVGACICNLSEYDKMNNLIGAIQSLRPTFADLTPTVACMFTPAETPSFETLSLGGEPLKQEALDIWAGEVLLCNGYGPAECSVTSSYNLIRNGENASSTIHNIGRPMSTRLWVANVKNHDQLVPIGCVGELLIEGPLLAREYLQDSEKTAKSFIYDPTWARNDSGESRRFYKSGDLVRFNANGSLHLVGRADTQVKMNGQRLELGDIEAHVTSLMPNLKQMSAEAVTLTGGNNNKKYLAVFFVPENAGTVQASGETEWTVRLAGQLRDDLIHLQKSLVSSLPPYMVPSLYIPMSRMPVNTSGKLDRKILRQIALNFSEEQQLEYALEDSDKRQPTTAVEIELQSLWSATLQIPVKRISARDNFFRLGGDSVVAMKLVAAARAVGLVLSVTNIFKHPILASMAVTAQHSGTDKSKDVKAFQLLQGTAPADEILEQAATQCSVSREAIRDIYPCTPLQEAMLALSIKQKNAYVGRKIFKLPVRFDIARFRESWNNIMGLEDILRTRIIHTEAGSFQVVLDSEDLWRHSETLHEYLEVDEKTPFAYGEPLCRIGIVGEEDNLHFVWTAHHAVYDGWSQASLFTAIKMLFNGESTTSSPPFKNFVKYLLDTDQDASDTFWRSQLTGETEPTSFPKLPYESYKPRASKQYLHSLSLSRKDTHLITTSTVMKAAWAKLVSRYSDSEDVIFALTDSGRTAPVAGIEEMTGPTITTVPLRVQLDPGLSVAEYLQRLQTQYVEMMPFAHRGLQNFQNLGAGIQDTLDLKHLFVFQPSVDSESDFLGFTPLPTDDADFNTYALVVEASWSNDRITIDVHYDEAVLDAQQVQRMLAQYEHIIRQLNEASDSVKVADVQVFCPEDLKQLEQWNSTEHTSMERCIPDIIRNHPGDTPAVSSWDAELSYQQLDLLSDRLAAYLIVLGVGSSIAMVPLCFDKSAWTIVSMLAVLKAGAAYVSLSPAHPISRLRGIVQDVNASIVLAAPQHAALFGEMVPIVLPVYEPWLFSLPHPTTPFQSRAQPKEVGFVIFTSGSTGKPKGVMIEHRTMVTMAHAEGPTMQFNNSTRVLHFAAPTFDVSNSEVWTTLMHGGCICVPSEHERLNDLAGVINRRQANWLFLTPAMADILDPESVPTLKTLALGGEAIRPDLQQKWAQKVYLINSYGPSETTIWTSNSHLLPGMRPNNIGTGYGANTWITEPDNHDRLAPVGCIGELLVEGPILARGYYNEPEKTAAAFIIDPSWSKSGSRQRRMYKTGDLVKYNSDGTMDYVGRKDTQVKLRGQRIELGEVEDQARLLLPDARHIVADVIIRGGRSDDKILGLFFELENNPTNAMEGELFISMSEALQSKLSAVQSSMAEVLPPYMVPSMLVPFVRLPTTASGKLNRKEIRNLTAQLSQVQLESFSLANVSKRAPSSDMEKRLQTLFSQVLNIPSEFIGADDNFFRLGGDSIKMMRLAAVCRKHGLTLSVADAFRQPKLSAMAHVIGITTGAGTQQLRPFSLLKSTVPESEAIKTAADCCNVSPESIVDIYPCTPLQEGVIDISLREKGSYIAQDVFRLPETLDHDRFKAAWQTLADIHPILRTRISQNSLQVVVREKITWETSKSLVEYIRDDMERGIELGKPLARYAIVEGHFVWTAHHAIYDGWSRNSLYIQLESIYKGKEAVPEPMPYNNFVHHLENIPTDEANAFWQTQLSGDKPTSFPEVLSLNNRPCPDQRLIHPFAIVQNRNSELLLSTILRAAWAMVIAKHSDSTDVVFAMALSGRNIDMGGIENVMGPTITTVPMRMRLDSEISIANYLETAQVQTTDMIPFAHVGLQNIQGLENKIDLRHLFVIHTVDETSESTVLGMQRVDQDVAGFDSYDLVIEVTQGTGQVSVDVRFNSSLVPAEGMQRMLYQFEHVVRQLNDLSASQAKLTSVEVCSPQDLAQMTSWNRTPPEIVDDCVHELVRRQVLLRPDQSAVLAWDGDFTYRQLDEYSTQLAHYLAELGVGPEVMVPFCFDKSGWAVISMLAILKAGGACVALNPEHPPSRLGHIIRDVAAVVVLTSPHYARLLTGSEVAVVCPDMARLQGYQKTGSFTIASPSNLAFAVFTSGSTGLPKGIMLEHRALCSSAQAHGVAMRLGPQSRSLQFAAYTFDVSIGEIFTTLIFGGTICVPSEYERMNDLAAFIRHMNVNWAYLTPTVASLLNPKDVPCLETLSLGGEALTRESISTWSDKLYLINIYGPAETTIWSTALCGVQPGTPPSNLGYGCGGLMWIADVNDHDKLAPIGCVGELLIEGPILARGYVNLEDKTKAAFIANPVWARSDNGQERRFYKSGDLCRYNHHDGAIEYVARKDTQVKLHGQRIEVSEIEHHLSMDENVRHSMIMLPKTGFAKQRLTAVVSLESVPLPSDHKQPQLVETAQSEVSAIRSALAEKVPHYMVPSVWLVVNNILKTVSGKMNRLETKKWVELMEQEPYAIDAIELDGSEIPTTDMEARVQATLSEILNMPIIKLSNSFLSLGGDSISAMQLRTKCRGMGIELSIQDILRSKSISQLAASGNLISAPALSEEEIFDYPFGLAPMQKLYFEAEEEPTAQFNQSFLLRTSKRISAADLARALNVVVERHSMLRARFSRNSRGEWIQQVPKQVAGSYDFNQQHCSTREELMSVIHALQKTLDIVNGPVFSASLIHVDSQQLVFVCAHHLVIDLVSWRVILQDLDQLLQSGELSTSKPLPYQKWCHALEDYSKEVNPFKALPYSLESADFGYWEMDGRNNTFADLKQEMFSLDLETTESLFGASNTAFRTEPLDIILSAFGHSFSQTFTDRNTPTIFNEGHGRESWSSHIDPLTTVGWFTTLNPLQVAGNDNIIDVLMRTKDSRRQVPANGLQYFVSRYLSTQGQQEFGSHRRMEVLFNYAGRYQQLERQDALLQLEPLTDGESLNDIGDTTQRFSLFEIGAEVSDGILKVSFAYNKHMKHQELILSWISAFKLTLHELTKSLVSMKVSHTLSDLPLLELNYDKLHSLEENLGKLGIVASEIEDIYPTAPMQQSMLATQRKFPGTYQVENVYEILPNSVDIDRLHKAWQKVTDRHGALRTVFIPSTSHGGFDQVVLEHYSARFEVIRCDDDDMTRTMTAQTPINCLKPLLQSRLIIFQSPSKIFCKIEISHALMDGLSMRLIMRDLTLAYEHKLPLEPAGRFSDYISYLSSQPLGTAISYWRSYLDSIKPCHFPYTNNATQGAPKKQESIAVKLNQDFSSITSFCKTHNITIANIFQVAWGLVLRQYVKSGNINFGYLTSGRDAPVDGIAEMVGTVIHMLVCRQDTNNETKILDLLQKTQEDFLASLPHQHGLIAALGDSMAAPGSEQLLFNTIMSIQYTGDVESVVDNDAQPELGFENIGGQDPNQFDLSVAVGIGARDVEVHIGYWNTVFTDQDAERIAGVMAKAVNLVLSKPMAKIEGLEFC